MYQCFFFNDTATTEIYTLSLHDALPICPSRHLRGGPRSAGPEWTGRDPPTRCAAQRSQQQGGTMQFTEQGQAALAEVRRFMADRKSTRLNSSHANISYAVFCLKKKTHIPTTYNLTLPIAYYSLLIPF